MGNINEFSEKDEMANCLVHKLMDSNKKFTFNDKFECRIDKSKTIRQFVHLVSQYFNMDVDSFRLVFSSYKSSLMSETRTLHKPSLEEHDDRLLLDIGLIFGKGTVNRFLLSVIDSGESDKAVCIVSTVKDNKIYPMEVDKNTTGSQFFKQIFSLCENDDFNTEFFTLIFSSSNQLSKLTITEDDTRLLSDIGVMYRHGVKNYFKIYLKNDVDVHCDDSFASYSPLKDQEVKDQSLKVNNSVSPNVLDLSSNTKIKKVRPVITRVLRPSTLSQYKYCSGRIYPEYKGLVNQAMTCYLNSLLQALYMTPEFRNALYTWKYDMNKVKKERSKSISFQLQQLFLRLQVSPQRSIETTKLTHIFGWSTGDAWLQQDLHEFSRIIIEALEKELQDTTHAEFINQLYQGKLIDSIKCLECNSLSSKEQRFVDLPLPIRSFKSNHTYGSLTEVFQGFIEPELLEGVDQYFCEKCNKKCNALKAFEFKKFPYILVMSLMRFSYSSSTNRAKVHDRVEFPQVLNLNSFISDNSSNSDNSKESNGLETELFGPLNMSFNNDETQTASSTSTCDKDKNKDKLGNSKTEVVGPYVYDLYAIIIHSGNISGGHYYAYIKDFKTNQWFCFNDQCVTMITMDDIERSFGGQPLKRDTDHNMSSTSAYMLIYRQIDKEKNRYAMSQEEFPPHIKCLQNFFEKTGKFKLRLFSAHSIESDLKSMLFDCNVTTTLRRLKTMAVEYFKITEPCQLVIFDEVTLQICKNLENELNNLVCEEPCFSPCSFLLKIVDNENKNIPKYITMNFVIIDLDSKFEVNMPGEIEIEQNKLLEDLSDLFFVKYDIHDDVFLHFLTIPQNSSKLIKLEKSMKCSSVYNDKIFVCMQRHQMSKMTLIQTIGTSVLQNIYTILLQFVLPENYTDILQKCKRLNIENSIFVLSESDVSMTLDKLKTVNSNLPIKDKFDCLSQNPQELCNAILGSESIVQNENNCLNDGERLVIEDIEMDFSDFECNLIKVDDLDTFRENNLGAPIDHGDLKSYLNEKHYFKKLSSPSENNGRFSAHVDKRMNVAELKNHLVPLVNIPFDCITLSVSKSDCTIDLVLPGRTLVDLNQCDTVKISFGVPLHQYLGTFYWLECLESSESVMKKMFDWIITAGTSVLDTKQELITKLKETNDFNNVPLERLRFRKKLSNLQTKCYLNDEIWTEHIGQEWEIIVFDLKDRREYELNKNEKLIMICHVANDSDSLGTPISDLEIIVDQVSSTSVNVQLGQMVSKTLKIHENDLEIGYINDLKSVVWKTKTSNWSFDIFNENVALYCRSRQKKLSLRLNAINYNDQNICPNVRCTPTNKSIHSLLNTSVTQFPKKRRSYALNDPSSENKKKTVI